VETIANKCNNLVSASSSNPTQIINVAVVKDDNDMTVVTSNCTRPIDVSHTLATKPAMWHTLAAMARHVFDTPTPQYLNATSIMASQVIANTEATSIFIMGGTPVKGMCLAIKQWTINLPDGGQRNWLTCAI
jgi:hypothetical protein